MRSPRNAKEKRGKPGKASSSTRGEERPIGKISRRGKSQRLLDEVDTHEDIEMELANNRPHEMEVPTQDLTHLEVIPETQLLQLKSKNNVYKEILASIGLDSPTTSKDNSGHIFREEHGALQANTPIRNSAASLIAMGKRMLTPRQSKIWELRSKSPLGSIG